MIRFMCLKYYIKVAIMGLNVYGCNWGMYISPPNSESEKIYR